MGRTAMLMIVMLVGVLVANGCQSASKRTVLPAPVGANVAAAHHNDEGIQAYQQGQWESAKQHFEAAMTVSPVLAEVHYNLGLVLYRVGALREGDAHFIQAANLAPGNKVIWDAPPLKSVTVPEKEGIVPASDGHMHSH